MKKIFFSALIISSFNCFGQTAVYNYNHLYNGGASSTEAAAMDASDNVYTVTNFSSTTITDLGNLTSAGGTDLLIEKRNSSGNVLWQKVIGSTDSEWSFSIAIGPDNQPVLTGFFRGTVDFDPGVGIQNRIAVDEYPSFDLFILKLDANGNFVYCNSYNTRTAPGNKPMVAVDNTNNSYVVVTTQLETVNIGSFTFNQPGCETQAGIILIKTGSTGALSTVKMIKGSGDCGNGAVNGEVLVMSDNSIIISGSYHGECNYNLNGGTSTSSFNGINLSRAFTAKYDGSFNFLWSKESSFTTTNQIYPEVELGEGTNIWTNYYGIYTKYNSSGTQIASFNAGSVIPGRSVFKCAPSGDLYVFTDGLANNSNNRIAKYNSSGVNQWFDNWGTGSVPIFQSGIQVSSTGAVWVYGIANVASQALWSSNLQTNISLPAVTVNATPNNRNGILIKYQGN